MITDDDLDEGARWIRTLLEALTELEPIPHQSRYLGSKVSVCTSVHPSTGTKCEIPMDHEKHGARIEDGSGRLGEAVFWKDSDGEVETFRPEKPLRARKTDPTGSQVASRRQFGSKGQQAKILEALEETGVWMTCRDLQDHIYGEPPYSDEDGIEINKLQSNSKKLWEADKALRSDNGPRLQYRALDSPFCNQRHEWGYEGAYMTCGVCGLRGWKKEVS